MLTMFLEEAPARQETEDFRKIIILKDLKSEEVLPVDHIIADIY